MARVIKRITVVGGSAQERHAYTVFTLNKKKRKRKVSKLLRPQEKGERRVLEALDAYTSELLDRHNRSNTKRRNGYLRDRDINQMKAQRKAWKKLTR